VTLAPYVRVTLQPREQNERVSAYRLGTFPTGDTCNLYLLAFCLSGLIA
jgi:hypothetical protein